jgi:hypothetical protein
MMEWSESAFVLTGQCAMIDQTEDHPRRAADDEALRLVMAFYCIMEPVKAKQVLALAERYAIESKVVDGYTHFLMLERDSHVG